MEEKKPSPETSSSEHVPEGRARVWDNIATAFRLDEHLTSWQQTWEEIKARFSNISGTNYQLGIQHYEAGNMQDALVRFKMASWFRSDFVEAWIMQGYVYLAMAEIDKANTAAGRAITLEPTHKDALLLKEEIVKAQQATQREA